MVSAAVYTAITGTAGNHTDYTPTADDSLFDACVRMAGKLAAVGAQNIAIAVNPTDFTAAALIKSAGTGITQGTYVGPPSALSGVRVIQSGDVTSNKIIGFDASGNGPVFYERETVSLQLGLSGEDLIYNLRTLLVEMRGVPVVRDPSKVLYGDFTS